MCLHFCDNVGQRFYRFFGCLFGRGLFDGGSGFLRYSLLGGTLFGRGRSGDLGRRWEKFVGMKFLAHERGGLGTGEKGMVGKRLGKGCGSLVRQFKIGEHVLRVVVVIESLIQAYDLAGGIGILDGEKGRRLID